jgi:hypothetical protein
MVCYKLNRLKLFYIFLSFTVANLCSQEALKSVEEEYYDFLALQGYVDRPTLNYRTLSDSVWNIHDDVSHPWQGQNLGTRRLLFGSVFTRIYGPELFMSFNTAAPYGQNDGALWQGKGLNSSLTSGVRFEGYGLELTFKPQLAFSQNAAFDYITSAYSGADYTGKAADYGYYGVTSIDAPQRFGNDPFFVYDWGDSEIRYTWKTLTAGFGTQPIWLGPARLNPIIHSNNAPSYPKFDIGIRRQSMILPRLNWYIGDIEARAWWGYLSESDYFDNNSSNDHNLITGFSVAYSFPKLLKGLTIGLNRIMLSKWESLNFAAISYLLLPYMDEAMGFGFDENDQRASFIIDYLLPFAGLNIYLEWGRNDYSTGMEFTVQYPFHTEGWTMGIKKSLDISTRFKGEILLEITKLEGSQDYDRLLPWSTTFYAHNIITQGHTNQGQWLGAGIGTGGNSQFLGFKLYYPKGYGQIFFQRRNPDLDYTYYIDSKSEMSGWYALENIRALLDFGISGLYHFTQNLSVSSSFVFQTELNPLNARTNEGHRIYRFNVHASLLAKYSF